MKKLLLLGFLSFQVFGLMGSSQTKPWLPYMGQKLLVNYQGKIHPTSINPYEILGVNQNSMPADITKSYRKLAFQHHPDKGGSTQDIQKINDAYEQLGRGSNIKPYEVEKKAREECQKEEEKAREEWQKEMQKEWQKEEEKAREEWQQEMRLKKNLVPVGMGICFIGLAFFIKSYSSAQVDTYVLR